MKIRNGLLGVLLLSYAPCSRSLEFKRPSFSTMVTSCCALVAACSLAANPKVIEHFIDPTIERVVKAGSHVAFSVAKNATMFVTAVVASGAGFAVYRDRTNQKRIERLAQLNGDLARGNATLAEKNAAIEQENKDLQVTNKDLQEINKDLKKINTETMAILTMLSQGGRVIFDGQRRRLESLQVPTAHSPAAAATPAPQAAIAFSGFMSIDPTQFTTFGKQ